MFILQCMEKHIKSDCHTFVHKKTVLTKETAKVQPRWESNHPVISLRRLMRCRGLPLQDSSWFSPLKQTILLSTPWVTSAEYI